MKSPVDSFSAVIFDRYGIGAKSTPTAIVRDLRVIRKSLKQARLGAITHDKTEPRSNPAFDSRTSDWTGKILFAS